MLTCKNKLSSGIYAINSLKNTKPTIQLKSLYYTLIHPYLTYGVLLWGDALTKTHTQTTSFTKQSGAENNQCKYNDPVKAIYNELGISTLDNLYKTELCKLMYLNS